VYLDMLWWQCTRICCDDSVPGYVVMTVYLDMLWWQCTWICCDGSVPGYAVMTVYQDMLWWQCTWICCDDSVSGYAVMREYQDMLWWMWDKPAHRLRSVVLTKDPYWAAIPTCVRTKEMGNFLQWIRFVVCYRMTVRHVFTPTAEIFTNSRICGKEPQISRNFL